MGARVGIAVAQVVAAAALFGTTGTAQALGPSSAAPASVGGVRLVLGGVLLLALLPALGARPSAAVRLWVSPAVIVTALCTVSFHLCFFAAVRSIGVALGTLVAIGTAPVFAGLLARLVLREQLTVAWLAATSLCLSGMVLLSSTSVGPEAPSVAGLLLAAGAGGAFAGYTVATKRLITAGTPAVTVLASAFSLGGLLMLPFVLTGPVAWVASPAEQRWLPIWGWSPWPWRTRCSAAG